MGSPPWLVDGFLPSAFREGVEGGVEDGESVGGYWRGRKEFNRCVDLKRDKEKLSCLEQDHLIGNNREMQR